MADHPDFESIYAEFRPRILRCLTRLTGEAEAEDLTQAVFEKVGRGLPAFRGDSALATWIYRIATNVAADRARSPLSREVPVSVVDGGTDERAAEDPWSGERPPPTDQQLIHREMNECIREVVDGLPADYRVVLWLSEFEGLTDNAIAEVLGVRLETVKIRLHRARRKLRQALECQCDLYRDERNELACDRKEPMVKK